MPVNQREVYYLPFPKNVGYAGEHPFIVLSVKEANLFEDTFIGVMITSSDNFYGDFSFKLDDRMFEWNLDKPNSHVQLHLMTLHVNKDIRGAKINTMKEFYFKLLMAAIGELVFNFDFKRLSRNFISNFVKYQAFNLTLLQFNTL